MTNLMKAKCPKRVLRDMMTYARRFTAKELVEYGLVEQALLEAQLIQ